MGGEDVNDRIFNGLEKEIPVFPDPDRTCSFFFSSGFDLQITAQLDVVIKHEKNRLNSSEFQIKDKFSRKYSLGRCPLLDGRVSALLEFISLYIVFLKKMGKTIKTQPIRKIKKGNKIIKNTRLLDALYIRKQDFFNIQEERNRSISLYAVNMMNLFGVKHKYN